MLLDFKELVRKYNMTFDVVYSVGAHFGEEYDDLVACGAKKIIMIEPCERAFKVLSDRFFGNENVECLNFAAGSYVGVGMMHTGDDTINKGQSNSLLEPKLHLELHKEVEFNSTEEVDIYPLDTILVHGDASPQLLVMDCQGYEGEIIKGATQVLKTVNYIYTEINFAHVYEGCVLADELDELLNEFERVETGQKVGGAWSDALYIRKTLING